jgi:UrcA family protein
MFAWAPAVLIATSLALGGPVEADEPQTASVSARGVNLADPAERAALERRIDRGAAQVCGVDPGASPELRRQQNLCMIATGNAARARLKQIEARREVRMAAL